MNQSHSLLLHAIALLVLYTLYGVLQEKILKGTYGPEQARFTSSALLIVCNRTWSIVVGLSIMYLKTRRSSSSNLSSPAAVGLLGEGESRRDLATFSQRLRPASHVSAYAAVAVFNFLSTSCQYEALRYVSYSTQSLAKCAKVVPVLLIGSLVWSKSYRKREWLAAAIIVTGCGTYLFSQAPPTHKVHVVVADAGWWGNIAGALFLMGYLAFDGLTSTTQERVFGRNTSASNDPFAADSPVLDQMIWVNLFAGIIAATSALFTIPAGGLGPNLHLLWISNDLKWDVTIFSMGSALGLIVLLNTIASFGALTSSTIMTVRQFLSILVNARIYGAAISFQGWAGVAMVGVGIWCKMYRGFDEVVVKKAMPLPVGLGLRVEREKEDLETRSDVSFETSRGTASRTGSGSAEDLEAMLLPSEKR